jgi:hypothetical protein
MSLIPTSTPNLDKLSPTEVERLRRLKNKLRYFAENTLKIGTKAGKLVAFEFNSSQKILDERLDAQLIKTGKVRVLIVKGRKMGCSTYVQGRYYHKLWRTKHPLRAFIFTHEQAATEALFNMAHRFQDGFPTEMGRPDMDRASAKELVFSDSGASYRVATAGTKAVGRGDTLHLFHGSEVAHWPNADTHVEGVLTAVGNVTGTEIILESTANGIGNVFHSMCMAAMRGQSEYELIFLPWYIDDTLQLPCPNGWDPGEGWWKYADAISRAGFDLTWEQLYWAFVTNRTLASSINASHGEPCWKFKQEYPSTVEEAFQTSGNSFIPSENVFRARHPTNRIIGTGPVILGVDPSRSDKGDKVGIIDRCGRRAGERICERMEPEGSITNVARKIARIIDRIQPDAVNIDVGGVGAGCYDTLVDMGYGAICNPVNFGSNPVGRGPTGEDLYFNRRAEMYDEARQWFNGDMPVQIADDDGLQGDICAAEWGEGKTRHNSNNELIIEEKDSIKKRLGASPDLGDAFVLTFAVKFAANRNAQNQPMQKRRKKRSTGY